MRTLIKKINPVTIVKQLFLIKGDSKQIAKSFSIGSFIGMMPIPGFQIFVSIIIANIFKLNKKAACLAVFNTNVFTGVFVFAFNYWLGNLVLGISPNFNIPKKISFNFILQILSAGSDVFLSLIVGGSITGIVTSLLIYHLIIYFKKAK